MKPRSYDANRCIDCAHMLCALNGSVLHAIYATVDAISTKDTRFQDCEGMAELNFEMFSNLVLSFLTIT